jgi:hypothetical protein
MALLIGGRLLIRQDPAPICPICGNHVELDVCCTDSNGTAVHRNCYAAKIADPKPKPLPKS